MSQPIANSQLDRYLIEQRCLLYKTLRERRAQPTQIADLRLLLTQVYTKLTYT
ncbi:hypothetical protein [Nostoc sp. DedQUE03]|uniref:hypothetical protein n=1 Tax=Nostoc sp. DedQUE03 TaxID=3075389 RepID=UPI002AD91901|nr:hypothetical protein [Nostoc sp. DedQUE03]MDZ8045104.1 hypothetical protein [Nostoc sp. DedQUE02]